MGKGLGLSSERASGFRECLIRQRFEHVDEYLTRIDECLRELRELGAPEVEAVEAIREARSAVTKHYSVRPGSEVRQATEP
jgi:hypothetical protein